MAFRRGDVVLVPLPFTDLSADKARPAVVINGPAYRACTRDIILAEITTHFPTPLKPNFHMLSDWKTAGLEKPSAAKAVLFTLEPSLIVHRIGQLTPADMAGVDNLLRRALDL